MNRLYHRPSALIAALSAALLAVSACSSNTKTGQASAGARSASVQVSGQPIMVGLDSMEGGPVSLPYLRIGAQTAENWVNSHGGVKGRPIQYVVCDVDGTAQASIACGNKFVSDHVVAVLNTYDVSADSMLPILASAGIPMFGHAAFGPVQQKSSSNARFFGTANQSYSTGFLLYYKARKVKHVLLFEPDNSFYHQQTSSLLDPIAKGLGLDVTVDYYNASNPNWQTLAAEALSAHPQVAGTAAAPDADCIGMLQALKSAGYPGHIFLGSCTQFLVSDQSQAPGVTTTADLWKPTDVAAAPASVQSQLQTYQKAMTAAGQSQYIDSFAQGHFSDTMDFAAVLGTISGNVTPASVSAALKAYKGQSFMGQAIDCAGAWPGASACGNQVLMYQVTASGSQVPLTRNWISTASVQKYLGA